MYPIYTVTMKQLRIQRHKREMAAYNKIPQRVLEISILAMIFTLTGLFT